MTRKQVTQNRWTGAGLPISLLGGTGSHSPLPQRATKGPALACRACWEWHSCSARGIEEPAILTLCA
jgi:hypothetical protein